MWDDEEDSDNDNDCDPEAERKRVEALPIFQKAEEIAEITQRIIESIDDEKVKAMHSNAMVEDTTIIQSKIANAEAVDDFIRKVENATLIKIHAKNLQAHCSSLILLGIIPEEYLKLLDKELDAFRLAFKQWIKTFNKSKKEGDGWGLFVEDDV